MAQCQLVVDIEVLQSTGIMSAQQFSSLHGRILALARSLPRSLPTLETIVHVLAKPITTCRDTKDTSSPHKGCIEALRLLPTILESARAYGQPTLVRATVDRILFTDKQCVWRDWAVVPAASLIASVETQHGISLRQNIAVRKLLQRSISRTSTREHACQWTQPLRKKEWLELLGCTLGFAERAYNMGRSKENWLNWMGVTTKLIRVVPISSRARVEEGLRIRLQQSGILQRMMRSMLERRLEDTCSINDEHRLEPETDHSEARVDWCDLILSLLLFSSADTSNLSDRHSKRKNDDSVVRLSSLLCRHSALLQRLKDGEAREKSSRSCNIRTSNLDEKRQRFENSALTLDILLCVIHHNFPSQCSPEQDLRLMNLQHLLITILPESIQTRKMNTSTDVKDVACFRGKILVLVVSRWLESGALRATKGRISNLSFAQALCMNMVVMEEVYRRVPVLRKMILQQVTSHLSSAVGIHVESRSGEVVDAIEICSNGDSHLYGCAGVQDLAARRVFFACLMHRINQIAAGEFDLHMNCVQEWMRRISSDRCTVKRPTNPTSHSQDLWAVLNSFKNATECGFSCHPSRCIWADLDRVFQHSERGSSFDSSGARRVSNVEDMDSRTEAVLLALSAFFPLLRRQNFADFLISHLNNMMQQSEVSLRLAIEILCSLFKHVDLNDGNQVAVASAFRTGISLPLPLSCRRYLYIRLAITFKQLTSRRRIERECTIHVKAVMVLWRALKDKLEACIVLRSTPAKEPTTSAVGASPAKGTQSINTGSIRIESVCEKECNCECDINFCGWIGAGGRSKRSSHETAQAKKKNRGTTKRQRTSPSQGALEDDGTSPNVDSIHSHGEPLGALLVCVSWIAQYSDKSFGCDAERNMDVESDDVLLLPTARLPCFCDLSRERSVFSVPALHHQLTRTLLTGESVVSMLFTGQTFPETVQRSFQRQGRKLVEGLEDKFEMDPRDRALAVVAVCDLYDYAIAANYQCLQSGKCNHYLDDDTVANLVEAKTLVLESRIDSSVQDDENLSISSTAGVVSGRKVTEDSTIKTHTLAINTSYLNLLFDIDSVEPPDIFCRHLKLASRFHATILDRLRQQYTACTNPKTAGRAKREENPHANDSYYDPIKVHDQNRKILSSASGTYMLSHLALLIDWANPTSQQSQPQIDMLPTTTTTLSMLWNLTLTIDSAHRALHEHMCEQRGMERDFGTILMNSAYTEVSEMWRNFCDAFPSAAAEAMQAAQEGPEARCCFHLALLQLWRKMLQLELKLCRASRVEGPPSLVAVGEDGMTQNSIVVEAADPTAHHLALLLRLGRQFYRNLQRGSPLVLVEEHLLIFDILLRSVYASAVLALSDIKCKSDMLDSPSKKADMLSLMSMIQNIQWAQAMSCAVLCEHSLRQAHVVKALIDVMLLGCCDLIVKPDCASNTKECETTLLPPFLVLVFQGSFTALGESSTPALEGAGLSIGPITRYTGVGIVDYLWAITSCCLCDWGHESNIADSDSNGNNTDSDCDSTDSDQTSGVSYKRLKTITKTSAAATQKPPTYNSQLAVCSLSGMAGHDISFARRRNKKRQLREKTGNIRKGKKSDRDTVASTDTSLRTHAGVTALQNIENQPPELEILSMLDKRLFSSTLPAQLRLCETQTCRAEALIGAIGFMNDLVIAGTIPNAQLLVSAAKVSNKYLRPQESEADFRATVRARESDMKHLCATISDEIYLEEAKTVLVAASLKSLRCFVRAAQACQEGPDFKTSSSKTGMSVWPSTTETWRSTFGTSSIEQVPVALGNSPSERRVRGKLISLLILLFSSAAENDGCRRKLQQESEPTRTGEDVNEPIEDVTTSMHGNTALWAVILEYTELMACIRQWLFLERHQHRVAGNGLSPAKVKALTSRLDLFDTQLSALSSTLPPEQLVPTRQVKKRLQVLMEGTRGKTAEQGCSVSTSTAVPEESRLKLIPATTRRRKNQRQRLRSRNKYIDECLENEDGTDTFADLEDFIVT